MENKQFSTKMPAHEKKHNCLSCGATDPIEFYDGRKTMCKKCLSKYKSLSSYRKAENKEKTFKCYACGEDKKENFYLANKSRCCKCISAKNFTNSPVKKSHRKRIVVRE